MIWSSVQRIFAAVAAIVLLAMMLFVIVLTFTGCENDGIEANKRFNFDVCSKQCLSAGTSVGTFEQGLGYVKCTCISKTTKDGDK